jgi:hypothetical protein
MVGNRLMRKRIMKIKIVLTWDHSLFFFYSPLFDSERDKEHYHRNIDSDSSHVRDTEIIGTCAAWI